MGRSKSSKRWLREHHEDAYVAAARRAGYRSRAVYKLQAMQQKDRILRPGMTVVDLGAAPGGWSQMAAAAVGAKGRVIALDLLAFDPIPGVEILLGDFREQAVLDQLLHTIAGRRVDLVMSDMAPNISGVSAVDQPRAMLLAELALEFCQQVLAPGGDFVVKLFQGTGFDDYLRLLRSNFKKVVMRKPEASRARSREVFALARGFNVE